MKRVAGLPERSLAFRILFGAFWLSALLPRGWALEAWQAGATFATNIHGLGVWGSNVAVAFVEASVALPPAFTYRIDPDFRFSTSTNRAGYFDGKSFTYHDPGTPFYTNFSDHAGSMCVYGVGRYSNSWPILPSRGIAPGARAIGNYAADFFIDTHLASNLPPDEQVYCFAWTSNTNTQDLLTRWVDRLVETHNKIFVQGVRLQNTNFPAGGGLHPAGMGVAYNILTVARCNNEYNAPSISQFGPSHQFGTAKPELLSGTVSESAATARGAGGAALLVEQAARHGWTNGSDPRVVKAIMLAGARKTIGWDKGASGAEDDHHVPLDYHAGAGIMDCLNNYGIMFGGEAPMASTNVIGKWAFGALAPGSTTNLYYLRSPESNVYVSVALAWFRHVDGSEVHLPDLNLRLHSVSGSALATELDWSTSAIDSVEHVWHELVETGQYAIAVEGVDLSTNERYGLAWRFTGFTNGPLHDADNDGVADAFEKSHFGEIYAYGAQDDPDNDGMNNVAEYVADTDPRNPSNYFHLSIQRSTNQDAVINFISSTARVYVAEYLEDVWTPASTAFWGNGGATQWVDDGGQTQLHPLLTTSRWYRVSVSLP